MRHPAKLSNILGNTEELAAIFKKHFSKIMKKLDIDETLAGSIASSDITDPVFNAVKNYEYHPSAKKNKHFRNGKDLQFSLNFQTKRF